MLQLKNHGAIDADDQEITSKYKIALPCLMNEKQLGGYNNNSLEVKLK